MIDDFTRTRAVVTGGASGIGRGIVHALLDEGASVFAIDLDEDRLSAEARRAAELGYGDRFATARIDVSLDDDMQAAEAHQRSMFGGVDLLVLNAGVAYNRTPLWETPKSMVDWTFGVNVFGVTNGVRAFVPGMIAAGTGGHVVCTSSIGGFQIGRSAHWYSGLYAASKFAVVALAESLAQDLARHDIGVSVLAPAAVDTGIADSGRVLPQRFGTRDIDVAPEQMKHMVSDGVPPRFVAEEVLEAVKRDRLYVFTHPEYRDQVEKRHAAISAGFDDAEARPRPTEKSDC